MERKIKAILGMLVILILLGVIVFYYYDEKTSQSALCYFDDIDETIRVDSMCHTNLQPTNYLTNLDINLIIADQDNKIVKILLPTEDFYVSPVKDTGSMRPAVGDFHEVLIVKVDKSELHIGDIISFKKEDSNILHRLINITDDEYYITKGDNNIGEDTYEINYEDINGKVVAIFY